MPLIFSYGTLQEDRVQQSTFERLLNGHKDELLGFEPSLVRIEDPQAAATSGKTHHANVTFNGRDDARVSGTVFEITDANNAASLAILSIGVFDLFVVRWRGSGPAIMASAWAAAFWWVRAGSQLYLGTRRGDLLVIGWFGILGLVQLLPLLGL